MYNIQTLDETYRSWAHDLINRKWGPPGIVTRGTLHDTTKLSGFVAIENNEPIGLITYYIEKNECEIVSLNSLKEKHGIGSALIETVVKAAKTRFCRRVWVIMTNDNVHALHFYQKRGFYLRAVYPNALEASRKIKPTIPLTGIDGIPLCDEIELEILL
ncbi:GNAT family N-acetyltransferase [Candidatus Gottesmanbacteria bacterium RIFCSPLOWO2_01_FULL_49_10]|uniref:GNAT family N-acetyltransferase n=1 Tax=Candidatus Gottesmanbacteria bacterium RIFCSPLOWO2_01_FULL_49_10 TaxID=1798396 RepID=A0A1F6AZA9_9BACT|nr:MAG: GNAT family N-acetyltransferase [Candidatus Gottesmanbacteria bacterium RIFCSPLOWO2_01_FULL_49_10]